MEWSLRNAGAVSLYAGGLTPAIAGEMSPAVFAGAAAPADLAGTDVPAVAEKEFSAVAEAWSLADDAEGSPLVIRVSKQLRAVVENIAFGRAFGWQDAQRRG